MKRIALMLFAVLPFLLTSCMYKNVKTGKADSVYKTYVIERNEESWIVNMESIFQASSKEFKNGTYCITGHNDHRISVYKAKDGSPGCQRESERPNFSVYRTYGKYNLAVR